MTAPPRTPFEGGTKLSDTANLVVLSGRLTGPVDVEDRGHGRRSARFTIAVPSPGPPRRVDALPVTWWDPPPEGTELAVGSSVVVIGMLHRRFWATTSGRSSRLDIVASRVEQQPVEGGRSGSRG